MMKDYYAILGIDTQAGPEEVKKAYRKKALQHHPDRNRDQPDATEKFKDVVEAYGVLIDPEKRRQYDMASISGFQEKAGSGQGFNYTQEEIFRDLFNNPNASQTFQALFKEFEKAGLRFDQPFLKKMFLGGRGLFFGGIFFFGTLGVPWLRGPVGWLGGMLAGNVVRQLLSLGAMKFVGRALGTLLAGGKKELPEEATHTAGGPLDVNYDLSISQQKADAGTWVKIALPKEAAEGKIKVHIPAGTKSGRRMRLKGKGLAKGNERGDLYIIVHVLR